MTGAVVSHRGGTFLWPENSLAAFRGSVGLGVEWVECDVHLSRDGVPVVMHDATLNRMTDASGPVSERGAAELAEVRVRGAGGEGVPRFDALVALLAPTGVRLQVEIKDDAAGRAYPGVLDAVLTALDAADMRQRAGIIAFEAGLAGAAARAGGLHHAAWLLTGRTLHHLGPKGAAAVCRAHGVGWIETEVSALDAAIVTAWRAAGLRVAAWGANHRPSIGKALALGLDAFASDDPALAMKMARG